MNIPLPFCHIILVKRTPKIWAGNTLLQCPALTSLEQSNIYVQMEREFSTKEIVSTQCKKFKNLACHCLWSLITSFIQSNKGHLNGFVCVVFVIHMHLMQSINFQSMKEEARILENGVIVEYTAQLPKYPSVLYVKPFNKVYFCMTKHNLITPKFQFQSTVLIFTKDWIQTTFVSFRFLQSTKYNCKWSWNW